MENSRVHQTRGFKTLMKKYYVVINRFSAGLQLYALNKGQLKCICMLKSCAICNTGIGKLALELVSTLHMRCDAHTTSKRGVP